MTAPTDESLQAAEDRAREAERAESAEQKRLSDKAKSRCRAPGEFTLTGSNSAAGVAAAAGQGGLFDAPPANHKNILRQEQAVHDVREGEGHDVPLDLFPETLPAAAGKPAAGPRQRAAAARDIHAAGDVPYNTLAIRDDPAMPSLYHFSTELVEVGRRDLQVPRSITGRPRPAGQC